MQVLPLYEPLHAIVAKRDAVRRGGKGGGGGSLKISLRTNKLTGKLGTTDLGLDAHAKEAAKGFGKIGFRSAMAETDKIDELLPAEVRLYREHANRLVTFKNLTVAKAPAPAAGGSSHAATASANAAAREAGVNPFANGIVRLQAPRR